LSKTVTPYGKQDASKKEQVEEMFDSIAPRYDLLNHLLTMGIDIQWRKKAIRLLKPYQPKVVADIATGTGDFAIAALALNPERVVGIDISNEMLRVGRAKMQKKGLADRIEMLQGDSENLKLEDNSIDAITVGFGVRNFENLRQGLSEMLRVLRPGGAVAILEPSFPTQFPLKQLFQFYFRYITPLIGKAVSGDDAAYTYLPESVRAFPNGSDFTQICEEVGYKNATYKPLTFGACSLYLLEK
jgi:demethylmenaquinone methyltransferase/2-methoxy-6-polyprenyl-1,4-benzoquinol methylase